MPICKRQQAEVEDLKAQIYYDVRTAFLDLQATEGADADRDARARAGRAAADAVARPVRRRCRQQHRGRAGAGGRRARQRQYISALYGFNVAKACSRDRSALRRTRCASTSEVRTQ